MTAEGYSECGGTHDLEQLRVAEVAQRPEVPPDMVTAGLFRAVERFPTRDLGGVHGDVVSERGEAGKQIVVVDTGAAGMWHVGAGQKHDAQPRMLFQEVCFPPRL